MDKQLSTYIHTLTFLGRNLNWDSSKIENIEKWFIEKYNSFRNPLSRKTFAEKVIASYEKQQNLLFKEYDTLHKELLVKEDNEELSMLEESRGALPPK